MKSCYKFIFLFTATNLFVALASAQVGINNPTGTSGQFNGNITTGCSVDPYTMNQTRSITDLIIAGGVGSYPLAFTRTANSRYTAGVPIPFGQGGNWNHSYGWSIDPAPATKQGSVGRPSSYTVNFPDGRRVTFSKRRADDPKFRGPPGVRERFDQLQSGGSDCYLVLPDGGKVHFTATVETTQSGSGSNTTYSSTYRFTLTEIIDPYGQRTTISQNPDGSTVVREPAGRTITIFYTKLSKAGFGIDRIDGSDGRSVKYNYTSYISPNGTKYNELSSVVYFNDPTLTATYTYQSDNIDPNGRRLLKTCEDPMYDGAMWKIAYDFAPTGTNADGTSVVAGQLLREKHPNGTPVSTLTINAKTSTGGDSRTETRGDNPTGSGNPTRTFKYNTYRLRFTSDFKGVEETNGYNNYFYINAVTDRRGNLTDYDRDTLIGNVTRVTEPLSTNVKPAGATTVRTYVYGSANAPDPANRDENNPYYLSSLKDGGGNFILKYFRNSATMQVTSIKYRDDKTELFSYNGFGQLLTHTSRRNKTESYEYDPSNNGQVIAYRDAAHADPNLKPTARYHYDALGRVDQITDARGTSVGDPAYTTSFQYNSRGQLTRLIHPDGTYVQYAYNPNGTLAWTADERHPGAAADPNQRTSYTYDDYKRLRTVTTPLRGPGDTTSRLTQYFYDQNGTGEDYTRTAAIPTKVISPGGKIVTSSYDQNLRTLSVTAVGDTNVPDAKTSYTYDEVGNVRTVTEPNGQPTGPNVGAVTTYHYDKQNRISGIQDPISTNRNAYGHTMTYFYDPSGNLKQEVRADDKLKTYFYNDLGRLVDVWGFGSFDGTNTCQQNCDVFHAFHYDYDDDGNMTLMRVPGGQANGNRDYIYGYDDIGRKVWAYYPKDISGINRTETFTYDVANHLWQYTNPAGNVKTLLYDGRGRLTDTSWNTNDPDDTSVHIDYDATRPTGITTRNPATGALVTSIIFGYDEANNRIYEDQTIAGLSSRRVQTDPDADGNRKNLLIKDGKLRFDNYFTYTSRNELWRIYDDSAYNTPLFTYSYDATGNVTERLGHQFGDKTVTGYDALNRPNVCSHYGPAPAPTPFSTSTYHYTKLGNVSDVIRSASAYEDGKGDYFPEYDVINQLSKALYSATGPTDTSPAKKVEYDVGSKNRKQMKVTNLGSQPIITDYSHNDLSQLTSTAINGGQGTPVDYDENFNLKTYNGWTYEYDAENRLVSVNGNGHSASFLYDAVGRCVRRTVDMETIIFTYDQWTPVMESDASGKPKTINMYGLGDDEILYSGGPSFYFYKSDPMGNVRFVLNASGTIVEKYTYDAFGTATITQFNGSAPTGNRLMYSGREFLSGLGLYDLRNRVYNPEMGRFYQTDPIGFAGDPTNLYRFCGHNPLLGGDPMGLDGEDSIGGFDSGEFGWSFYSGYSYGGFWGSDSIGFASAAWWGDSLSIADTIPWSSFADTLSNGLFFGSNLIPIGTQPNTSAQGTFNIQWIKQHTSGTIAHITYTCPTCKNIELRQMIRGSYLPRELGGKSDSFVADLPLRQTSRAGFVKAFDQAGVWYPPEIIGGDPLRRQPRQLSPPFTPFWQEMETVAICKDNGQEKILGAWFWGHTFTGMAPTGGGFRYNQGRHQAYLPTRSGYK